MKSVTETQAASPVDGAGSDGAVAPNPPAPKKKPVGLILAVIAIAAALFGYRTWSFSQSHASTDDAAIAATVIDVSPQVAGRVSNVLVDDNQLVKKGDLLATIDDATFKTAVQQAQANLDAAIAAAQAAGVSVKLTAQTGSAQVQQAQGVVGQAEGGIASAQTGVTQARAAVDNAKSAHSAAQANAQALQASLDAAISAKNRASDAVVSANAAVDGAKSQVAVALASVVTAQAAEDFAAQEDARYANLLAEGVTSAQTAQSKSSAHRAATAQLDAAKQGVASANAVVAQRLADVQSARDQLISANASIAAARAQLAVSHSQASGAADSVRMATARVAAANDAVISARAKAIQAEGQLAQAGTMGAQVDQSKSQQATALAKVEQARAELDSAKLQLGYTQIYAPVAGRVSKKSIDVGEQVQAGTPMMGIVDESDVWVVANFKETQMPGLDKGRYAEVEVDGLPGRTFKGHVDSVSAGTGSTFALLPPDNASGNFTKVVQRIPVKVILDAGQPDLDKLRVGMSVTATVTVK